MDATIAKILCNLGMGETPKDAITNTARYLVSLAPLIYIINEQWSLPPDFLKAAAVLTAIGGYYGFGASGRSSDLKSAQNGDKSNVGR